MSRGLCTILLVFVLFGEVASLLRPDETIPGDYPFMVGVNSVWNPADHFCGGSLISSRTVLTAAHCVEYWPGNRQSAQNVFVTLGDYAINRTEENERRYAVKKIIVHEEYSRAMFDMPVNDIALLILHEDVEIGDDVGMINLPVDRGLYQEGGDVRVIGWGGIDTDYTYPITLKQVDQVISNQKSCEEYWGGVGMVLAEEKGIPEQQVRAMLNSGWKDGFLCTSTPVEKRRFWYGDSGGPVFVEGDDGEVTQLSLVSWNTPEDTEIEWETDYDMSVDLLFYIDWIRANME